MLAYEHYTDYCGPEMHSCLIDGIDYTEAMRQVYGPDRNWQGLLYTYKEMLEGCLKLPDCSNTQFRIEYKDENGATYWEHSFVNDKHQYYNPTMFTNSMALGNIH